MGFVSNGEKVILGKGKIFLDRLTSGARTGERYVGTCEGLNVTPTVETKDIYDFATAASPLLKRTLTKMSAEISMTLRQWDDENLAVALLGTSATDTQTGSTVTAEAIDNVKLGTSRKTAKRKISAVVVKKSVTPLTLGTDYDIADATVGLIYFRTTAEGSTLTELDDLTVDYTYASETTRKVTLATTGQPEFFLRFIGDPTVGPVCELEIWKCSLVPDGPLDFISEEYGSVKLKGAVLVDATNHPTEPYGVLRQR